MSGSEWRPNLEQRRAVAHGAGPLRIQAGAGSGKTTTLVHRIHGLVEQGLCRPGQVLMLTFTNKAAAEMRERVAQVLGPDGDQPCVETYHAFALSLVRTYAHHLGLPPDPVLLTEGPLRLFLRQRLDRLGVQRLDLSRPSKAVSTVLEFLSWHRHEGTFRQDPESLLACLPDGDEVDRALLAELLAATEAYRALLREHGAADYDDLIALAVALLEEHSAVRQEVQERFPFILVDEYQDTDHLQGRFIQLLAGDSANLTIVGDPDQTVYSFRGAAMTNILHFHEAFPALTDVAMVTNYRSTPEIVAAANAVIRQNQRRKEEELVAARAPGEHPLPLLLQAPDWPAEARWLAAQALALHQDEGIPYGQMAVLVRKNHLKLPLYGALLEAGVPARLVGGLDLFADTETSQFIGYLEALADPGSDTAMAVALGMPRYGLSERDIARLARERAPKETLLDTAVRLSGSDQRLRLFTDEFWPLYRIVQGEGCLSAVGAAMGLHGSSLSPQARANAEQLLPLAAGFLERPELFTAVGIVHQSTLQLFCDYLQELREVEPVEAPDLDDSEEAVRLMSVHAAKGLEFPVLFLPRLTDKDFAPRKSAKWTNIFPLAWHHDAAFVEDLAAVMAEEERRLFYVAATRARDRLFLSWAPIDPHRVKPVSPSPFLAEIGPCCQAVVLDEQGEVAADHAEGLWGTELERALTGLVSDKPALRQPEPTPSPGFQPRIPSVLSFSHLHTYQLCPFRFSLQYLHRLPGRPSQSANAGVLIHAAIERLAGQAPTGESVDFEQFRSWAAEPSLPDSEIHEREGETEPEESGSLIDALRHFWASEYATIPPLGSEQEFYLNLGGTVVRGFIDRLHRRPDGTVEVVDFKTYNRLLSPAEVKQGLQLPLYIEGCRRALGYPEARAGALFFLRQGEVVRVSYTDEELAGRLKEAERLVAAIREGDWAPTPGAACRFCPYRDTCPVAV